jgi:hypothetical protein
MHDDQLQGGALCSSLSCAAVSVLASSGSSTFELLWAPGLGVRCIGIGAERIGIGTSMKFLFLRIQQQTNSGNL